ncbi:hypothetical protein [Streptomyces olivochromogenes]|uniref:Uncharacterized protein n=1 Tax=Streptomyces olivochromogenes TaxID=1963 RepID=A0A250VSW1_STROL|nr:hypothetical protein [Streptomyces olivochromogenes]KUN38261.1 hypothetical protein AQJ27_44990 [Streptomyces olivochromogenes]GAX57297.1 hypothetical protein SO3561_08867 [Streptomyces olivochromogenes]
MTTVQAPTKRRSSPLLYPAVFLSLASLAWTTWSLVDLIGTGPIALTAASGADIVWGSVIIAEARGLRIARRAWPVPTVGWITLLLVASFLSLHGIEKNSLALAVVGPFLPLGAKVVWVFALADLRDPAALTHDELHTLAEMERGMVFEEQQHRIEMRRRQMGAELLMTEVSTDFDIELTRQDRQRDLMRRRPLELTTGDTERITQHHDDAHQADDAHHSADAAVVLGVSPAPHSPVRSIVPRTNAVSEVAARGHDAPQMPSGAPRTVAPHNGDAALHLDGLSKAAAVRVVRDALPTASAPQIVARLAHHGIDASDAYVRTVLSRTKQQRTTTDGGYL